MIFVTVGTHEQPFDRLVLAVDELKERKIIQEEVMVQTGYSTVKPQYCRWKKWLSKEEMEAYMRESRIVITHGGPSSFFQSLQMHKIPIVVPRQKKYGEHVNDHQVSFVSELEDANKDLIVVKDLRDLARVVRDYEELAARQSTEIHNNNKKFNHQLSAMVNNMLGGRQRAGISL